VIDVGLGRCDVKFNKELLEWVVLGRMIKVEKRWIADEER
jgi:hypothetical protein